MLNDPAMYFNVNLQVMEDPRLAGGNYTGKEERISILVKYDKVIIIRISCQVIMVV